MIQTIENAKLNEKYYYFKHESGLDIYVFPKNYTTSYALFGTKYGSIDNTFKTNADAGFVTVPEGIAHFLEHKLFEEADGTDAFKRFAETGANANAYTSFDKTCYLFSCADNGEKFDKSLEILLDFVTHPYFNEASVNKEQGIIGQEIMMYEDSPGWQVYFQMLSNMYENHNIRLDICGTADSISNITPDILFKCYDAFYNLNNMDLCVSGDVTVEQIKKVADKVLKSAAPVNITRCKCEEPEGVRQKTVEKKLKVSKPLFNIGIKDCEQDVFGNRLAKKSVENDILMNMVFSQSSDFYTRLYEKGTINNKFGWGHEIHPEYAHWIFNGESDNPMEVLDEIIKEFEAQSKNGLDRDAFERFKRTSYAGSITVFDDTESIANAFLNCMHKGYNLFDLPEIIGGITFEDVKKRLNRIYKKENFIISIINPI